MVKCKFEHGGYCRNCGAMQYMDKCEKPCDTIDPITNADRIRAMSDEELAVWLVLVENRRSADGGGAIWHTSDKASEWLKLPVKDGDNDGNL